MSEKIKLEPKFVSLAEAFDLFSSRDVLLALLKEGTVRARGRSGRFSLEEEFPSEAAEISASAWADLTLTDGNRLTDEREEYISAIEIEKSQIAKLVNPKSKGGRPEKWVWEDAWPEIFLDAFEVQPQTLDGWVRQASNLSFWRGKPPEESHLRRKLAKYFNRLKPVSKSKSK